MLPNQDIGESCSDIALTSFMGFLLKRVNSYLLSLSQFGTRTPELANTCRSKSCTGKD